MHLWVCFLGFCGTFHKSHVCLARECKAGETLQHYTFMHIYNYISAIGSPSFTSFSYLITTLTVLPRMPDFYHHLRCMKMFLCTYCTFLQSILFLPTNRNRDNMLPCSSIFRYPCLISRYAENRSIIVTVYYRYFHVSLTLETRLSVCLASCHLMM